MSRVKILAGAGLLVGAALIGGTLIGSVLGAPSNGARSEADVLQGLGDGTYCEVFLDEFAAELGVDREALGPAAQAAATAAVDAAVAEGDISEERAERIRERIAEADGNFCGWLASRPGHGGPGHLRHHALAELTDLAASELGLERDELVDRVRNGESLQEIATAEGVDYDELSASIIAATETRLAEAVENGRLSQERADRILANLTEWLEAGGEGRPGQ